MNRNSSITFTVLGMVRKKQKAVMFNRHVLKKSDEKKERESQPGFERIDICKVSFQFKNLDSVKCCHELSFSKIPYK